MKRKIYAVHDRDLEDFLKDLNLLEEVQRGELKCPVCSCTITFNNIGFISMHGEEVQICCDDLNCFYKVRRQVRGVSKE